jgi:hypothetical protein
MVCEYLRLVGHNVLEAPAYSDLLDAKFSTVPDAVFTGADSVDAEAVEIVLMLGGSLPMCQLSSPVVIILRPCGSRGLMYPMHS